jgi:hypothetical protein
MDNELPKWTKSRTDIDDPQRANERKASELPM